MRMSGGMKCLVEHVRLLKVRGRPWCRARRRYSTPISIHGQLSKLIMAGHTTIAVHRSATAARAMPPWTDIKADVDVVCKLHQRLNDVYPVAEIDVVVVGIFHQVHWRLVLRPRICSHIVKATRFHYCIESVLAAISDEVPDTRHLDPEAVPAIDYFRCRRVSMVEF